VALIAHCIVFGREKCGIHRGVRIVAVGTSELNRANRVMALAQEVLVDIRVTVVAQRRLILAKQWQVVGAVRLMATRTVVVLERAVLHGQEAKRSHARMTPEAKVALVIDKNAAIVRRMRVMAVGAEATRDRRVNLLARKLGAYAMTSDTQVTLILLEQHPEVGCMWVMTVRAVAALKRNMREVHVLHRAETAVTDPAELGLRKYEA